MIIDVLVVILLALAIFKGYRRGLIVAVFSVFAFIIGLAAALKLSGWVAGRMDEKLNISERWLPFLAFALVFLVVLLLVRIVAKLLQKTVETVAMGWANRLGGILFYALGYLLIFSVLLFYAEKMELFKPETLAESVTYPIIRPWAPFVIDGLGKLIPFFRDMFADLQTFFDSVSQKLP